MNKGWLSLFILISLMLVLGGVRHSPNGAKAADDPVSKCAAGTVAESVKGTPASWQNAAEKNPQWLLEIAATGQAVR